MNTNKLSNHYSTLTPTERLSLLLAAAARSDDVEHARLMDSAPRVTFRVPHTFGRSMAFMVVHGQHRMDQLNLAALFFKASAFADTSRGKQVARFSDLARLFGYLVKIHEEGWALFCERERLDSSVFSAALSGDFVLELAMNEADLAAFTADEARDHARRKGHPLDNLKTADKVAEQLGAIFKMWVEHWA